MRVRNAHTAPVAGISPGAEGEVDETVPGVAAFLRARLLVGTDAAVYPSAPPDFERQLAERDERIRTLEAQVASLEEQLTAPERERPARRKG